MTNFTADQIALKAHIEAKNAEWVAECEANGSTFYTTSVSDLDHWAEMGVFSIADYDRYSLVSYIWDAYKDAYGFRPRNQYDFDSMTIAELEAECSRLTDAVCDSIEEDRIREEAAIAKFEATVSNMMVEHSIDRQTAVRWLVEAEDDLWMGDESFCYNWGLPFSYNFRAEAA